MSHTGRADHWLIDGRPCLLRQQPLANTPYYLLALANLEGLVDVGFAPAEVDRIMGGTGCGFTRPSSSDVGTGAAHRPTPNWMPPVAVLAAIPTEIERGVAVAPQDLPRIGTFVDAGCSLFMIRTAGPALDLSWLPDWIYWRDAVNAAT